MASPRKTTLPAVLLVDGDRRLRESLAQFLGKEGFGAEGCGSLESALARLRKGGIRVVVSEVRLPDGSGLDLLPLVRELPEDPAVILATAFATVADAVAGMRSGAFDFLSKPVMGQELLLCLRRAVEQHDLRRENRRLRARIGLEESLDLMIGRDPRMRTLFGLARSVAGTRATVLISGESGTGKTIMARAIHRLSPRAGKPFVEVACGALPETLLESELFGHARGAFTGANGSKVGRFEQAHTGTLFLDEVATASPALQVKLLRFLQDRSFERVGESRTRKADVRLILATNTDLEEAVQRGEFRKDLYYRVHVVHLHLPPLRERPADIIPLARHFLAQAAAEHGRPQPRITRGAARRLLEHTWPGNARELENSLERAVLLGRDGCIRPGDLPDPGPAGERRRDNAIPLPELDPQGSYSLKELLREPERRILEAALAACNGNRERAARLLGINRATLFAKIRKLGLNPPRSA